MVMLAQEKEIPVMIEGVKGHEIIMSQAKENIHG